MIILVVNDDGVHAPGIQCLARFLEPLGEVYTVAPDRDRSGSSRSLTLNMPIRLQWLSDRVCSVQGSPADCVHLSMTGLLPEKPTIVISGINAGANLADDVEYSGTVAGAIEGQLAELSPIAVSLTGRDLRHYETAARFVFSFVQKIISHPLPSKTIFNINVPDVPYNDLKGSCLTHLGSREAPLKHEQNKDPRGHDIYWIGRPGVPKEEGAGSDFHAIAHGFVSITPLSIELTDKLSVVAMQPWMESFASEGEAKT
jgi:5'-nucleotidase